MKLCLFHGTMETKKYFFCHSGLPNFIAIYIPDFSQIVSVARTVHREGNPRMLCNEIVLVSHTHFLRCLISLLSNLHVWTGDSRSYYLNPALPFKISEDNKHHEAGQVDTKRRIALCNITVGCVQERLMNLLQLQSDVRRASQNAT